MDDASLDRALIAALLEQAALRGWSAASIAGAARDADLPLDRVRARFPGKSAVLLRFGLLADQAALGAGVPDETPRERLFDMLMRRFDSLQQHRDGILALLRYLPRDPGLALLLQLATQRSMRWLLDAAGLPAGGLPGVLRSAGLTAIWLRAVQVWQGDESQDLSATMAAVDKALDQASRAEAWLPFRERMAADAAEVFEEGAAEDASTRPGSTPEASGSPPQIM